MRSLSLSLQKPQLAPYSWQEEARRELPRVKPAHAVPRPAETDDAAALTASQTQWKAREDAWKSKSGVRRSSQGGNRTPRAMSPRTQRGGAGTPARGLAPTHDEKNDVYGNLASPSLGGASASSSSMWSLVPQPTSSGSSQLSMSSHDQDHTPYSTLPRDATLESLSSDAERTSARAGPWGGGRGDEHSSDPLKSARRQPSNDSQRDGRGTRPPRVPPTAPGYAQGAGSTPVMSRRNFAATAAKPPHVDPVAGRVISEVGGSRCSNLDIVLGPFRTCFQLYGTLHAPWDVLYLVPMPIVC